MARLRDSRRRYRENNAEKLREIDARYRANLSEDKRRARAETSRQWRADNPDRTRETRARWAAENQDVIYGHLDKRRALMASVEFLPFSTAELLDTYGTDCHLCGKPVDLSAPRWAAREGWEYGLHVDHVIPLSKGGEHSLANCRPAHGICNLRKSNKI